MNVKSNEELTYPPVPTGYAPMGYRETPLYADPPYNHGVWTRKCCGEVIPHNDPDNKPVVAPCPHCASFHIVLGRNDYSKRFPYTLPNGDLAVCREELPPEEWAKDKYNTWDCKIHIRRGKPVSGLDGIQDVFHSTIQEQAERLVKRAKNVTRFNELQWSLEGEFNWRRYINAVSKLQMEYRLFSGTPDNISMLSVEDIDRLKYDGKYEEFQKRMFVQSVNNIIAIKSMIKEIVEQMNSAGSGMINAGISLSFNM